MERKTAHDFDQELLILFDAYVHGALDRRGFLDKAARFAVGGVTAAMLLDQLSPKFLAAQVVKPDDANTVLALTGKVDTVFITKNGGLAWERITTLGWQESTSVFDIAFAGSKLYATTSHGVYVLNSF